MKECDTAMTLDDFLNLDNEKYKIQVIAPTFTYGTMYGLDSKYDFEIDFDEYDTVSDWEFNVIVDGKTVATFSSLEETKEYILKRITF